MPSSSFLNCSSYLVTYFHERFAKYQGANKLNSSLWSQYLNETTAKVEASVENVRLGLILKYTLPPQYLSLLICFSLTQL